MTPFENIEKLIASWPHNVSYTADICVICGEERVHVPANCRRCQAEAALSKDKATSEFGVCDRPYAPPHTKTPHCRNWRPANERR